MKSPERRRQDIFAVSTTTIATDAMRNMDMMERPYSMLIHGSNWYKIPHCTHNPVQYIWPDRDHEFATRS
jgi:hypothetical protein